MICCGKQIKIEAEICADPIWCGLCKSNLDLEEFSLSKELTEELENWNLEYGNWLEKNDYNDRNLKLDNFHIQHNKRGLKLTEKVQKELGAEFSVVFAPIEPTEYR